MIALEAVDCALHRCAEFCFDRLELWTMCVIYSCRRRAFIVENKIIILPVAAQSAALPPLLAEDRDLSPLAPSSHT